MYHRIADDDVDPWGLAVPADRFEEQVTWLRRSRTVLPLAELARRHRRGDLPAGAVAITFDDGYACNATTAAPILTGLGVPATVFVTTGPVAAGREFWWDELQQVVATTEATRLEVATDERRIVVELGPTPATPREAAYLELWRAVRALAPDAQAAALDDLRDQAGIPAGPRASHRPMTVDELQGLARSELVDIGCHTMTHPALTERSPADQRAEVEGGLRRCEALIGRTPSSFAYPFGDHDAATVDVVRDAGFEVACTTQRAAVTAGHDVLALPRVQVGRWSATELARTLRDL
jgi:peptidoglycan/xylan/chitin deacetylase (PgdA/CDA1 family)